MIERKSRKFKNHGYSTSYVETEDHLRPPIGDMMARNTAIGRIVETLGRSVADWDYIEERVLLSRSPYDPTLPLGYVTGLIGELVLSDAINGLVENSDDIDYLLPEPDSFIITDEFIFKRRKNGEQVNVTHRGTLRSLAEYDSVVKAERMPVIIESRIVTNNRNKERVANMFNENELRRKLFPLYCLDRYYYQPVGFVCLTAKDGLPLNSPGLNKMLRFGAMVVELPLDTAEIEFRASQIQKSLARK